MLRVDGTAYANCDRVTRRNFLQVGVPLLGLGLADFLKFDRAAAADGVAHSPKSIIVFWTHGGMSQQDTYDMKPSAPAEYRGMYTPINTSVAGTVVSGLTFYHGAPILILQAIIFA